MHDGSEAGSPVSSEHGPITIKKYANRRLYNTATSCYVTLDYLAQLVKTGAEFAVYDAKTGKISPARCSPTSSLKKSPRGRACCPLAFFVT